MATKIDSTKLQPSSIFSSLEKSQNKVEKLGSKVSTSNKRWPECRDPRKPNVDIPLMAFTIPKYVESVIAAIKNPSGIFGSKEYTAMRNYLIEIVKYAENGQNQTAVEKSFAIVKEQYQGIAADKIATNFGEVLAPIFAVRWVKPFIDKPNATQSGSSLQAAYGSAGASLKYILFPDVQNYPLFDFFISDGYIFGFSVKGTGSSNPLGAAEYKKRYSDEKWIKTLSKQKAKKFKTTYKNEIALFDAIAGHLMMTGPLVAMSLLINSQPSIGSKKSPIAGGISLTTGKPGRKSPEYKETLEQTLAPINLADLATKIESKKFTAKSQLFDSKGKSTLGLNDTESEALINFLLYFSLGRSKQAGEFEKFQNDRSLWTLTQLTAGMIQYICDGSFPKMTEFTRELFPDLNIIKVKISSNGIPTFQLQEHRNIGAALAKVLEKDAQLIKQGSDYAFRSKARFKDVSDKLGVQL